MNEQCLFIGGPDCISGTVHSVPHYMDYFKVATGAGLLGRVNCYDRSEIQVHEYRRSGIRDSKMKDHFIFFHSSISKDDEVAELIKAAKKKKP